MWLLYPLILQTYCYFLVNLQIVMTLAVEWHRNCNWFINTCKSFYSKFIDLILYWDWVKNIWYQKLVECGQLFCTSFWRFVPSCRYDFYIKLIYIVKYQYVFRIYWLYCYFFKYKMFYCIFVLNNCIFLFTILVYTLCFIIYKDLNVWFCFFLVLPCISFFNLSWMLVNKAFLCNS